MAVSIEELIAQKEMIAARGKQEYDLETSVGTVTVKLPTRLMVLEALKLEDSDSYLLVNCIKSPKLNDRKLMEAFGCMEPTDVPDKIFQPGEIGQISRKIMELTGYRRDIHAEVHETAKN
ncbi:MAG: hypothetical protein IJT82_03620 [Schwartzia sp.]|nr:hypothetical protein [Schwartzia sp. (in: firmicutes)]